MERRKAAWRRHYEAKRDRLRNEAGPEQSLEKEMAYMDATHQREMIILHSQDAAFSLSIFLTFFLVGRIYVVRWASRLSNRQVGALAFHFMEGWSYGIGLVSLKSPHDSHHSDSVIHTFSVLLLVCWSAYPCVSGTDRIAFSITFMTVGYAPLKRSTDQRVVNSAMLRLMFDRFGDYSPTSPAGRVFLVAYACEPSNAFHATSRVVLIKTSVSDEMSYSPVLNDCGGHTDISKTISPSR